MEETIKLNKYENESLFENNNKDINLTHFIKINFRFKKKIRSFKYIYNIISLLLFCISYYLYYLSLEKCYDGVDRCSLNVKWIKAKAIELLLSCIINSILFEIILFKKLFIYHIIHFILIFIYFYNYSHGSFFEDHGYFNFIAFFISFFIILIGLYLIIQLIKNFKKHYIIFISAILTILSILYFYFFKYDPINCNDWGKGLNNTYLENDKDKYGCEIIIPKKCIYKLVHRFQDLTKIEFINCANENKNARKEILEKSNSPYINKNTLRIGYPLTNKNKECFKDSIDQEVLTGYFLKNIIDMDNINNINISYQPEIIADFSKSSLGELKINLLFNKTLSDERKLLENNIKPYSENILILYIDSVSRGHSLRQLKKTLKFVEKFMPYKGGYSKKYPEENFHSFQFFKYHSHNGHTESNYPLLFYGRRRTEYSFVSITKYLKENGYITGYVGDWCQRDNTRTYHESTFEEADDHQMILCDPNKKHFVLGTIKCFYGKSQTEYLYEYGKQFWKKYKDNRKFLRIITNDGHEGTLETLKYYDDIIYNFLNSLLKKHLLKQTSIFLLSDHGCAMSGFYYFQQFFKIEERLPMLYIIINDRENVSYKDQYFFIQQNQQTFITAYDIYNTIGHLLYGDNYISIKNKSFFEDTPKSILGQSLFTEINRTNIDRNSYKNIDFAACQKF